MIDRLHCGRMRNKTADFRVGQNSQFAKRDKIADFDNETKPPILEWDKTTDSKKNRSLLFVKIKVVEDQRVLA